MRRALTALALAVCLAAQAPHAASAQEAAVLVADEVLVEGENRLIARGSVEALQDGTRLQAARIIYDRDTDSLTIEGPIRLTDPDGNVLVAEAAQLDSRFENGLMRGARLVLDRQLQLAAVEARRVDGRYTQLSRVAVTSCQVCGRNATPLWQIRASRVIHDEEERQLYFDNAQLRVLDIPVLYLPRIRLPDPTVERARGFLIPTLRSSTLLGFGITVPYFIPLGPHQDITLTPFLSPVTRTLEYRYRRAFARGDLSVTGAFSSDTLRRDQTRGYVFVDGEFRLRDGFRLRFDIQAVSDDSYLNDYNYDDRDRLTSGVRISRARRNDYVDAALRHYESLNEGEDNSRQPTIISDLLYERRLFPGLFGGEVRFAAEAHSHFRYSDDPFDGPDEDRVVDGRDVTRLNAELSWQRRFTLAYGMRAGLSGHLWFDRFAIDQDETSPGSVGQVTPGVSADLRWPLARRGAYGGRTLIEPLLQVGWVGGDRGDQPNDESTRVEFDEANLLSLSRFPAPDRRERGLIGAAGLRWLHEAPSGRRYGLTLGRIWRDEADADLSRSSGLSGTASDWLVAGRYADTTGLSLSARGLFDGAGDFSKAEARAGWSNARLDLGASYVLLIEDPDEDRAATQSEWTFDGSTRLSRHWTSRADWRYDLADQRLDRAGLGLQYRNECIEVNFSVSRRFASSDNLEPSTDFGLTVALKGFGIDDTAREYRRTCRAN